jgi:hypothetical protein
MAQMLGTPPPAGLLHHHQKHCASALLHSPPPGSREAVPPICASAHTQALEGRVRDRHAAAQGWWTKALAAASGRRGAAGTHSMAMAHAETSITPDTVAATATAAATTGAAAAIATSQRACLNSVTAPSEQQQQQQQQQQAYQSQVATAAPLLNDFFLSSAAGGAAVQCDPSVGVDRCFVDQRLEGLKPPVAPRQVDCAVCDGPRDHSHEQDCSSAASIITSLPCAALDKCEQAAAAPPAELPEVWTFQKTPQQQQQAQQQQQQQTPGTKQSPMSPCSPGRAADVLSGYVSLAAHQQQMAAVADLHGRLGQLAAQLSEARASADGAAAQLAQERQVCVCGGGGW